MHLSHLLRISRSSHHSSSISINDYTHMPIILLKQYTSCYMWILLVEYVLFFPISSSRTIFCTHKESFGTRKNKITHRNTSSNFIGKIQIEYTCTEFHRYLTTHPLRQISSQEKYDFKPIKASATSPGIMSVTENE